MIIVLTVVMIAMLVVGYVMFEEFYDMREAVGAALLAIGIIGTAIGFIVAVVLSILVSNLSVIDAKIEMYEQENAVIETQISETVKQYQEYESGIYKEVAPESAVTLVSLYPDLKSDTLVQKQIEVYLTNNDKIKELKESKISGSVKRWWLYFGG